MVGRLFPEQKTEGSNPSGDVFCRKGSEVAQRKRVGLITQRSVDRNHPSLPFGYDKIHPRRDSNPRSSAPETDALPLGHGDTVVSERLEHSNESDPIWDYARYTILRNRHQIGSDGRAV